MSFDVFENIIVTTEKCVKKDAVLSIVIFRFESDSLNQKNFI